MRSLWDWIIRNKEWVFSGVGVFVLGGIFLFFKKWIRGLLNSLLHYISRYKPKVPRETIRVLPQFRGCWWGNGTSAGKPAMQIVARWHVTNITGINVQLPCARLPELNTEGHVLTRHPNNDIYGSYPILPGETTEVSSDFWVIPPVRKLGEDLKTTVVLVDQYGNQHKIKNVVFVGIRPREPKKTSPSESIHLINDPIEKEIVAVLKAEITRYKECGRPVGGLGSIYTTIQGRVCEGIGPEWREANSPKNQSILEDESVVEITSDNATALINLHSHLKKKNEVKRYFDALLVRLNKQTEYAPVGYFILYVMFKLGRLNDALDQAKSSLYGDDAFGFSDFLRLLDGLLRYRHSSFSSDMLDHIGLIIESLEEHTFGISERLAAIRAFRLAKM